MPMPNLEALARNQLLLHQLLAGLPNTISKQLCATGSTTDLDRVSERTCLLIMKKDQPEETAVMSQLSSEVLLLKEQIANLTKQRTPIANCTMLLL